MSSLRFMVASKLAWLRVVTVGVIAGCSGSTDPLHLPPITGTAPKQFPLSGPLSIARHANPDSQFLIVTVPVTDSTAHRTWTPTIVSLSSQQLPERLYSAVPFACLRAKQGGGAFPFNFSWIFCNKIFVRASRQLRSEELSGLLAATMGVLVDVRTATSGPGAFLLIEVPTGESAVAEAARRARMFSYVMDATEVSDDPVCVRSDAVPPPACPVWHFALRVPFKYGAASGDTLLVSSGGVIDLKYTDGSGITSIASVVMP